jgi:hypothetical protein
MKEAHHPKMQYDTNATWYITRWLSYHGLYIKQSTYIHQRKHGMIYMVQKEIPQESTRKGNKPQVPPASAQMKLGREAWLNTMVASWSWVGTWLNTMVPFSTLSLKKWYLTSKMVDYKSGSLDVYKERYSDPALCQKEFDADILFWLKFNIDW